MMVLDGPSTIWHSDDVWVGIPIGIACSNDVQRWNSNHQHANDVGHHSQSLGGSTWNLPGNVEEIAVSPGSRGKTVIPGQV